MQIKDIVSVHYLFTITITIHYPLASKFITFIAFQHLSNIKQCLLSQVLEVSSLTDWHLHESILYLIYSPSNSRQNVDYGKKGRSSFQHIINDHKSKVRSVCQHSILLNNYNLDLAFTRCIRLAIDHSTTIHTNLKRGKQV